MVGAPRAVDDRRPHDASRRRGDADPLANEPPRERLTLKITLSLLFGLIVATTVWGWLRLNPAQRFKVSLGVPPSVEGTTGKGTWLLLHLGASAMIFASAWVMTSEEESRLPWAGAALLLFFLLIEYRAIRRAARN